MTADELSIVVRLFVFVGALGLLPSLYVSFSAHTAILLALLIVAGVIPASSAGLAESLTTFSVYQPSVSIRMMYVESLIGFFFAVSISVAMYFAFVFGRWLSLYVPGLQAPQISAHDSSFVLQPSPQSVERVIHLSFLVLLFSVPSLLATVFAAIASPVDVQLVRAVLQGDERVLHLLVELGSDALLMSLLLAVPFFVFSFLVDFGGLLLARIVPKGISWNVLASLKATLLVLLLAASVVVMPTQIERWISDTVVVPSLTSGR